MRNISLASVLMSVGLVGLVLAGPVSADDLSQAAWTAHVDLSRLSETSLGERIRTHLSTPALAARLNSFQAVFRFDPRTDLYEMTMFGVGNREEDAVAIVRGAFDAEHIATVIRGQRSYRVQEIEGQVIHGWTEQVDALGGFRRFHGAFPKDNLFIFGQNPAAFQQALSGLGRGPVADLAARSGGFLTAFLDTSRISAGNTIQAALLRHAQTVTFVLSEGTQGDNLNAHLTLMAIDGETAGNLKSIADGMLSVLLLQAETNPELAALARSARVSQEAQAVTIDFELSPDILERMIRDHVPQAAHL